MSAFNVLPRAQCLLLFIILINNVYSNLNIFTCCHPGTSFRVSRFRTHSAPVPGLNFSGLQCASHGPCLGASCAQSRGQSEADGLHGSQGCSCCRLLSIVGSQSSWKCLTSLYYVDITFYYLFLL